MSDAYDVSTKNWGIQLTFKGFPQPEDVARMNADVERHIKTLPEGFGVIVDMRANRAFSNEAAEVMKGQIETCKQYGMSRGAVVLQSAIMTLQAKRLATETGVADRLRFIDASAHDDWEKRSTEWIQKGTEPA